MGQELNPPECELERPRFDSGMTYITPMVHEFVSLEDIWLCLSRHRRGEWGDLDPLDRDSNERALLSGGRLFSEHIIRDGRKLWVITDPVGDDGQRHRTTMLFPREY
jgi:hypothetical protein